jgi:hypothetical protein
MRHEQALPTQQLANPAIAGTSAFVAVAFLQTHVKGESETALANLVVLKCCGKELIKRKFPTLSLALKAQCGCESIKRVQSKNVRSH